MFCVEYLKVIYCKDLVLKDFEVIWVQIKFFIIFVLFLVIYRLD